MLPEQKVNILLVDDQPANLTTLERILAELDQSLIKATSGREALHYLLQQDVAVILLDTQMPEMDGFETAALIRKEEQLRHTPILFIGPADRNEINFSKGHSLGAVDYLFRPLDPNIVKSRVKVFVDLFKSTQGIRDQAERLRQSHQELDRRARTSEQTYRLLMENVVDYAIFTLNPDGRVDGWNIGAERILGYPEAQIIGQHFSRFFTPEDIRNEKWEQELQKAATIGRAEDERWHVRKNGTRFWASGVVTALRDEVGKLRGFAKVLRDSTERKEAREEREQLIKQLEAERTRLEAVLQQMPAGVVLAEAPSGRLILSNKQVDEIWRFPFYPSATIEEYREYKGFHSDGRPYQPEEWPLARSVTKGEVVMGEEIDYLRGDGTRGRMRVSSAPIRDRQGLIIAAVATFYDITEQKRIDEERARILAREQEARKEAEEANRAKDEFLSTISHELRTPLASMLGWARMLRTGTLDEITTARALESIERNAKLQAQLVDDILDVSRIITGRLRLDVLPVELAPIIKGVVEIVRPAAEAKSISLQTDVDPAVGPVLGDPNRLQQIIWNLLSNAVKFTPKRGQVTVRLERVGSNGFITVSDTGLGIRPDVLPHIFERFRQADSSTTRSHTGLGLGLAIVRHLVELHGGTVHAESPGEGQGATFTVKLPLAAVRLDRVYSKAETKEPLTKLPNLSDAHVLLVDDEADTLDMLTLVLQQCGAQVTAVTSAEAALEVFKKVKPDILVSDIGMPDQDGYELIHKIRTLESQQGTRVPAVALTAYAQAEDRMRALSAGFQMHVSKPVEPAELATVIASLIGRTGKPDS